MKSSYCFLSFNVDGNNNNQKATEFLVYKPNSGIPDGRKRSRSEDNSGAASDDKVHADTRRRKATRGTWSNDRRLRLLTFFVERDPLAMLHGEHTDQWLK